MDERESTATARPGSLTETLHWRASHQGDEIAYTFLVDGESDEVHLSYRDLDRQARAVAARLQPVAARGERALLVIPPGLQYVAAFFGCLVAGVVAVPAYPPSAGRPVAQIAALAVDSGAAVILTTGRLRKRIQRSIGESAELKDVSYLVIEDLAGAHPPQGPEPSLRPDDTAYLQYTSGSTSTPRGVALTHANLMCNLSAIERAFAIEPTDVGVFWLPPYHDMGLVGGLLASLYAGARSVLMAPVAFLQRPVRWLEAVARYGARISGAPDSAYELCLERIPPERRRRLDLSGWTLAFDGAEPIRAETLERFAEGFAASGFRREAFYPCYGLAEATLMVTGGRQGAGAVVGRFAAAALERGEVEPASAAGDGTRALVGCGRPVPGHRIVIADPLTLKRSRPDRVGEIWVSGPSVANGYWNRREETERIFRARPSDAPEGPFLRTGDLGFLHDDELFVTGRLKDLIIVRGRNLDPRDLELTAERSHSALRTGCGAAISVEVGGRERLVVVQELRRRHRQHDLDEVVASIRGAVSSEHDVETHAVVLVQSGGIPKTTSGKVRRHACRERYLAGALPVVRASTTGPTGGPAPGVPPTGLGKSDVEDLVRTLIAELLEVTPEDVDIRRPVGELGLGSLRAVALFSQIEDTYGVELPLDLFHEDLTIVELIDRVPEIHSG